MKRHPRNIPLALVFWLPLLCLGCSSHPQLELQAAQEALQEADEHRAAQFAEDEYKEGVEFWQEAQARLAAEDYGPARLLLIKSRVRFEKARDLARSQRDRILREAEGVQQAIELRTKALRENVESLRFSASRQKELDEMFAEIEAGLEKIAADLEKGNFTAARDHASAAMRIVRDAEQAVAQWAGGR